MMNLRHSAIGIFGVVVISSAACGSVEPTGIGPTPTDGGVVDPDSGDAATDASTPPVMPYPQGPYGAAIGERMADFEVLGYALSRQQRDAKKLPYRRVSLGEARTPECQCMVVIWDATGTCFPSVQEYQTLSSAVMRDPSLCAMEIIAFNFDSAAAAGRGSSVPATRADVDEWVGSGFQPYPVGMASTASDRAVSAVQFDSIPQNIIVRPSDMTILGYVDGVGDDLIGSVKKICASPQPGPEDVVTGLAPTAVVVDEQHAYVLASDAVVAVDFATKTRTIVIPASAGPQLLAHDVSGSYVATRVGATTSIVRLDGSTPGGVIVATDTVPIVAMTASAGIVYFTRADGTVASIPGTGGPIKVLASGEPTLGAIDVARGRVYFIAGGEVVSVPVSAGAGRTVHAAKGSIKTWRGEVADPRLLAVGPVDAYVASSTRAEPGAPSDVWLQLNVSGASNPPTWAGPLFVALASTPDHETVVRAVRSADGTQGGLIASTRKGYKTITGGTLGVNGVALNDEHVYFTIGESAPGKADGRLRRILR